MDKELCRIGAWSVLDGLPEGLVTLRVNLKSLRREVGDGPPSTVKGRSDG